MDSPIWFIALAVLSIVYVVYKKFTSKSIAHIPGPKSESFLLGNLRQFYQGQAGEIDFKWQEEFGGVVRVKAPFGEDRLWISDPKALQYIYQTSGYDFRKQMERRAFARLMSGPGLVWADGEIHKMHRKVMLPGFGSPESKAFLPIFRGCAQEITSQWMDIIGASPDQSSVFNVLSWMARATMDAIGEAAFDYKFGAMDNAENALARSYKNIFANTYGTPSAVAIFVQGIMHHFPMAVIDAFMDYSPSPRFARVRDTGKYATSVAKDLIAEKTLASSRGKGNKDVLSLLVSSNLGENPKGKMKDEHMYAQMRTLLLAGHETTANTMSWLLLELSKQPAIQTKLRDEIRATEAAAQARGDSDITSKDFDAMPYTIAVMKEVLRLHPVSYENYRQAAKDQVVPLFKPITTLTGEVIDELFVPAGTNVILSIAGYNRDKDIWGEDSHTFRPERWLEAPREKGPSVGVYGNLLSFSAGVRSCIGWRFAVVELQAFIVELVGNFQFSLTPEVAKIRREACLVMVPTLEGEVEKGGQLPLRVAVASRE